MPDRSRKRPTDVNELAKQLVDEATGEAAPFDPDAGKDPAAVALGRKGGLAENLTAAVSLHFAYYNLCRPHKTLGGQTPAMAAGVSDHQWTLAELIGLLESAERTPTKRGSYRKRISN